LTFMHLFPEHYPTLAELLGVLRRCPTMTSLNLQCMALKPTREPPLSLEPVEMPSLKTMSFFSVIPDVFVELFPCIRVGEEASVRILHFEDAQATATIMDALEPLAEMTSKTQTLQWDTLDVGFQAGCLTMGAVFKDHVVLTVYSHFFAAHLRTYTLALPRLRELTVAGGLCFEDQQVEELALNILDQPSSKLTTLKLRSLFSIDQILAYLLSEREGVRPSTWNCPSLHTIEIDGCEFSRNLLIDCVTARYEKAQRGQRTRCAKLKSLRILNCNIGIHTYTELRDILGGTVQWEENTTFVGDENDYASETDEEWN
jgi:hypothetical protein